VSAAGPSGAEPVLDRYPDARTFLGLELGNDERHWRVPLQDRLLTAGGFVYGGAGLAAAVAALEATTGRPLVWATAQYLSFARPPGTLDVTLDLAVTGSSTTQARATITVDDTAGEGGGDPTSFGGGRGGGRGRAPKAQQHVLTTLATLGRRPAPASGTWAEPPDVPSPAETRRQWRPGMDGTVHEALDMRIVHGVSRRQLLRGKPAPDTGGRAAFWLRLPGGARVPDGADLALVGDTVPSAFATATGEPITGNSLDNTLRVGTLVHTEWVLVDVHVHALADGYGHGIAHLWSEDGTLLGTASQSAVIRTPPP